MVDIVHPSIRLYTLLPSVWQRSEWVLVGSWGSVRRGTAAGRVQETHVALFHHLGPLALPLLVVAAGESGTMVSETEGEREGGWSEPETARPATPGSFFNGGRGDDGQTMDAPGR